MIDRPAHVLHVVRTLGTGGGMEQALHRVIKALSEQGMCHSIALLSDQTQIIDFGECATVHRVKTRPNDIMLPFKLWRLIRRIRPSVIHSRNWGAWPDVAIARLLTWPPVPLIFSFHGFDTTSYRGIHERRKMAIRLLFRITTRMFAVSKASRDRFAKESRLPLEKIEVIPNGIDVNLFSPRQDWKTGKRLVMGTIGRLELVKNQALVIRALARLSSDGLDTELRIAGTGSQEARLRELGRLLGVEERLVFTGFVTDVGSFLRSLDVFVLPSESEGHPSVLLQAMACQLPCVATSVGGVPEVLGQGKYGILVSAGDEDGLVEAISMLSGSEAARRSFGQAARRRVSSEYSLDRMIGAYERLYTGLSGKRMNITNQAGLCRIRGAGRMPSKEHLLDIRRVNGEEGLHAIKEDWNHVLRGMSCKRYFHLYQWYSSYVRTLEGVPSDVNFFVAYRRGEPVAVFPLRFEHQSVLGLRSKNLAVPSHSHMPLTDFVFEKNDENRDLLCEFIDYLIAQQDFTWDMLVMPHILEGSSALYGITNCRRRITYVKKVGGCDYIECKAYDKMLKGFSKSFRGNLRRARNKLAQMDGVEYTSERHGDNLFQSLEEFLDVEASGWKGVAGTKSAIRLHPEIEEFYRCLASEFSAFNGCEITLLKAEGVCLAGQFCLLVDDTCYTLKTGYNEKYRKISPGKLIREHLLKNKDACKGTKYINMISNVDWHRRWQPSSYDVFNAYVFNRSARGVGFYALLRTKKALASVYHKFIKVHL